MIRDRESTGNERRAFVRKESQPDRHVNQPTPRIATTTDDAVSRNAGWLPSDNQTRIAQQCDVDAVFRQLIEDEIRSGRLTKSRRRRIVRYAAQLRLSAVEAGQLIEACRQRVLEDSQPQQQPHALRLVQAKKQTRGRCRGEETAFIERKNGLPIPKRFGKSRPLGRVQRLVTQRVKGQPW